MPVDDPIFQKINSAQWMWYGFQITKDEQENFELLRDIAEHNAMFMNPDGVSQVREARENTFITSDEDFETLVEQTFGHKPNLNKDEVSINKHNIDHEKYLGLELDEIKFIPFKG